MTFKVNQFFLKIETSVYKNQTHLFRLRIPEPEMSLSRNFGFVEDAIKAFVRALKKDSDEKSPKIIPLDSVPRHISTLDYVTVVEESKGVVDILREYVIDAGGNVPHNFSRAMQSEIKAVHGVVKRRSRRIRCDDKVVFGFPYLGYPDDFTKTFLEGMQKHQQLPCTEKMRIECANWMKYISGKPLVVAGTGNGNKKVPPKEYLDKMQTVDVQQSLKKGRKRKGDSNTVTVPPASSDAARLAVTRKTEDESYSDVGDTLDWAIESERGEMESLREKVFELLNENDKSKKTLLVVAREIKECMEKLKETVDSIYEQGVEMVVANRTLEDACCILEGIFPGTLQKMRVKSPQAMDVDDDAEGATRVVDETSSTP